MTLTGGNGSRRAGLLGTLVVIFAAGCPGEGSHAVEDSEDTDDDSSDDAIEFGPATDVGDGCKPSTGSLESIRIDMSCTVPTGAAPAEPNLETGVVWEWDGMEDFGDVHPVCTSPIVARSNDAADADGSWVAFVGHDSSLSCGLAKVGHLVVVDGRTGKALGTWEWMLIGSTPAFADLDLDGTPEIVAVQPDGYITAVRIPNIVLWRSADAFPYIGAFPSVTAADFDMDGFPEVAVAHWILDGLTGEIEVLLEPELEDAPPINGIAAFGDIDRDGLVDVVYGGRCYDASGVKWAGSVDSEKPSWGVIVDADGDEGGEVVIVDSFGATVHDSDGDPLAFIDAPGDEPGPPCVADFDGDGEAEIAWSTWDTLTMAALDGHVEWSRPLDHHGPIGCAAFDFDADGAMELVRQDLTSLQIFDGATGVIVGSVADVETGGCRESPVFADLDADGHAELLVPSTAGPDDLETWTDWTGVRALEPAVGTWPAGGREWRAHDHAPPAPATADGLDLSRPPWRGFNIVRGQPPRPEGAADLEVSIESICGDPCPSTTIHLALTVTSRGTAPVDSGIPFAVYDEDQLLAVVGLPIVLPAGTKLSGWTIEVPRAAGLESTGIRVRADDDGTGAGGLAECDEDDNEDEVVLAACVPR